MVQRLRIDGATQGKRSLRLALSPVSKKNSEVGYELRELGSRDNGQGATYFEDDDVVSFCAAEPFFWAIAGDVAAASFLFGRAALEEPPFTCDT